MHWSTPSYRRSAAKRTWSFRYELWIGQCWIDQRSKSMCPTDSSCRKSNSFDSLSVAPGNRWLLRYFSTRFCCLPRNYLLCSGLVSSLFCARSIRKSVLSARMICVDRFPVALGRTKCCCAELLLPVSALIRISMTTSTLEVIGLQESAFLKTTRGNARLLFWKWVIH
jgi:hypothetical protein